LQAYESDTPENYVKYYASVSFLFFLFGMPTLEIMSMRLTQDPKKEANSAD